MPATKYNSELIHKFESIIKEWDPFVNKDDSKILDEFFDKGFVGSIGFHLGLSRPTLKNYCDKYPAFKELYEQWLRKRDYFFLKLARIYHKKPANTAQWIYLSKNILGWSDKPTNTEDDDNSIPLLIKVIESSARKISIKKRKKA